VGPTVPKPAKAVLSVIYGDNDELIRAVAKVWIKPTDLVLDVTYGGGKWWKKYRPASLITHDIALDGVDFCALPEETASVDVVAFDPPYVSTGNKETSTVPDMYERYGMGEISGWKALLEYNIHGLTECIRVLAPGGRLLMKCGDWIESGGFRQGHLIMVQAGMELGLKQLDEFVHLSGTGPQPKFNRDGSPRRQVHSRRAHTFLVVMGK
jgi:hypothetical protein